MKAVKHILLAVMLAVSSAAWAEWVKIGSADTLDIYTDPATIRKSGDKVKMWSIYDFETTQVSFDNRYLSQKGQHEYDCKDERIRVIFFAWHSEKMGAGDVVYIYNGPGRWEPVPPESINEALWKVACGKMG